VNLRTGLSLVTICIALAGTGCGKKHEAQLPAGEPAPYTVLDAHTRGPAGNVAVNAEAEWKSAGYVAGVPSGIDFSKQTLLVMLGADGVYDEELQITDVSKTPSEVTVDVVHTDYGKNCAKLAVDGQASLLATIDKSSLPVVFHDTHKTKDC
jgi:hypothetical protein